MMNLGLKSTFPRLCNTVVKKRELIIEGVHSILSFNLIMVLCTRPGKLI